MLKQSLWPSPSKVKLKVAVASPLAFFATALYSPPSWSVSWEISRLMKYLFPSFLMPMLYLPPDPPCWTCWPLNIQATVGAGSDVSWHSRIMFPCDWRTVGFWVKLGGDPAAAACCDCAVAEPRIFWIYRLLFNQISFLKRDVLDRRGKIKNRRNQRQTFKLVRPCHITTFTHSNQQYTYYTVYALNDAQDLLISI